MKIKKPNKTATATDAAPGGAAIADRFRLDPVESGVGKNGTVNRKAATTALVFGLIALAVTIVLAVTIYKHWEYLRGA
jgi:hypothetical protein